MDKKIYYNKNGVTKPLGERATTKEEAKAKYLANFPTSGQPTTMDIVEDKDSFTVKVNMSGGRRRRGSKRRGSKRRGSKRRSRRH